MFNEKSILSFLTHAKRQFPSEACGFLIEHDGVEEFVACRNSSEKEKDNFEINARDYFETVRKGKIIAVCHSHTDNDCRASNNDISACLRIGLPWFVVSLPDVHWSRVLPTTPVPYVGREFKFGVFDCYTLIRDWYIQEMNILLPHVTWEGDWWEAGRSLYVENFRHFGFIEVESLEKGDSVMLAMDRKTTSHAAIYLGDGIILHHLEGRLSTREEYSGFYQKLTTHRVRYASR